MEFRRVLFRSKDLARHYEIGGGLFAPSRILKAVAGASFTLSAGRTLAVVGESGCGKSTLARMVTMIEPPTSGRLNIAGTEITEAGAKELKQLRPTVPMVFQNPFA